MRSWLGRLALLLAVAAAVPACGGGGALGQGNGTLAARLAGGQGTDGDGGTGGYWEIYQYHHGDVEILNKGDFDTTFSAPSGAPYLGSNPYTVSANTTLSIVASLTGAGQILAGGTADTIRGDDGVNPATGLWVKPGVTLTVPAHYDSDDADANGQNFNGTFEQVYLELDNGVYVQGTLVIGKADSVAEGDAASPDAAYHAQISCANFVSTGVVQATGQDNAPGADGGDGGPVYVYSYNTLINHGRFDTSGGEGDNGGDGGYVYWEADAYNIFNTGLLDNSGGRALDVNGFGGDAGGHDAYAGEDGWVGGWYNSGTIRSTGGDGPAGGGTGGYVYVTAYYVGDCVNTGTINSSGGHATVDGSGGDADYIEFESYGGAIRVKGSLQADGGNGAGGGSGGSGDWLYFYLSYPDDYPYNDYNSALGIYVGADLRASGGTGSSGGSAGGVYAINGPYDYDYDGRPGASPISFVGYGHIELSGGHGAFDGGDTGYTYINNYGGYVNDSYGTFVVASVRNEANFSQRGGDGADDDGGEGAYFEMYQEYNYDDLAHPDTSVVCVGSIDLSGGRGADDGGDAGQIFAYAYHTLRVSGRVVLTGGASVGDTAGEGGYVELYSDDLLEATGGVFAHGGSSSESDGGSGDEIYIYAKRAIVGSVNGDGGNGGFGAGQFGGDGAYIEIVAGGVPTSVGAVSSNGGSAENEGLDGEIWILGLRVQ